MFSILQQILYNNTKNNYKSIFNKNIKIVNFIKLNKQS